MGRVTSSRAKKNYFKKKHGRRIRRTTATSPRPPPSSIHVATSPLPEIINEEDKIWTSRALDVAAEIFVKYENLEKEWEEVAGVAADALEEQQQQLQQLQQQQQQIQQQQQQQTQQQEEIENLGHHIASLGGQIRRLTNDRQSLKERHQFREEALMMENEEYRTELARTQQRVIDLRNEITRKTRENRRLQATIKEYEEEYDGYDE